MTLRECWLVLTHSWKMLALFTAAGLLIGLSLALAMPSSYMSTARLFVAAEADSEDPEELTHRIEIANARMASYLELATSDAVIDLVAESLGNEISVKTLEKSVSVSSVPATVLLDIQAVGSTPEQSREIALAFAVAIPEVIEQVETVGDGRSVQVELTNVDTPKLGESATPSVWLSLALGGLLGLVLGAGFSFILFARRHQGESNTA